VTLLSIESWIYFGKMDEAIR